MDDQLRVALNNLRPSDWDTFETFASAFLVSDFPSLRPIGGTNDKGRDGVLFSPDSAGPSAVVLQYSLVEDWKTKIKSTIKRLEEKDIPCTVLIYATSRDIGSASDELERDLRHKGVALAIRDREWWVIRAGRDSGTRHAVEQMKRFVLGRMLGGLATQDEAGELSLAQVDTGLFFLEMHLRDADGGRNLTRVAFEAMVLASLAGTASDHRKAEAAIVEDVAQEFPSHDPERLHGLTRAALRRLKDRDLVTISVAESTYALHYKERSRLAALATERVIAGEDLDRDLENHIGLAAETLDYPESKLDKVQLVKLLRRLFEEIAMEYGNAFATAVIHNSVDIPRTDIYDIVERMLINDSRTLSMLEMKQIDTFNLLTEAATQTLLSPAASVIPFLHSLSEAYTVRAFLRATPDVQDVVDRLFSSGRLVLDTTVLLPVFVETLVPEPQQLYTNLLRGAAAAGLTLIYTEGVINEAASHLRRCRRCAELGSRWAGPTPMVLDRWRSQHGGDTGFIQFVDDFLGTDPEADVEDFLTHSIGLERHSLEAQVEATFDLTTRSRLTELWRERKRWSNDAEVDVRLKHDVEMYLGVLAMRHGQPATVAGFDAWWVTLETSALALRGRLKEEGIDLRSGPIMHPNFLTHLLAVGPARKRLTREQRVNLPLALTDAATPWGVPEVQDVAAEIRREYGDRPEYFKRRKLRERMNEIKSGRSPLTEGEIAYF